MKTGRTNAVGADRRLLEAAASGNEVVLERALKQGGRVEATDKDKATPLVLAAAGGHTGTVRLLLQHGAKVNHSIRGGSTALSFSAYNGHETVVDELLAAGADVNVTIAKPAGRVPVLVYVAAKGYRAIAELFIKCGANLNPKNAEVLPLPMTAQTTDVEMARLLLKAGADVNGQEILRGLTALMWASLKSSVEMVQLLISAGADVNTKDNIGMTALMFAAKRGEPRIVNILLSAGADPSIAYEDPNGKLTALDMARARNRTKVESVLEKWQEKHRMRRRVTM